MNDVLAGKACHIGTGSADILPLDGGGSPSFFGHRPGHQFASCAASQHEDVVFFCSIHVIRLLWGMVLADLFPSPRARPSTRASPVPLLESRPRPHRAQYASDCGRRGAPKSSRPSAPPCNAASPARSCDPLPLTETTMVSFSTPAPEPSLEGTSPRSAAARLPERWSGLVKL